MVYFFSKRNQFVRCVLDVAESRGAFRITLIATDGTEHHQMYASSSEANERWTEMQRTLVEDGWEGPLGIDPRF